MPGVTQLQTKTLTFRCLSVKEVGETLDSQEIPIGLVDMRQGPQKTPTLLELRMETMWNTLN